MCGGRPRKHPDDARLRRLDLKLTTPELAELRQRAALAQQPLRVFIRFAALGQPIPTPVPEVNLELVRSLARLGGLINQWMHAVHCGDVPDTVPLAELAEVRKLLSEARAFLEGR
jgi:hypothetical protein